MANALERLSQVRGLPESVTVDNGPEFAGKVLDEWAYQQQLQLRFIEPDKPQQNAYVGSFKGKFRDECLTSTDLYQYAMRVRSSAHGDRNTTTSGHTVRLAT